MKSYFSPTWLIAALILGAVAWHLSDSYVLGAAVLCGMLIPSTIRMYAAGAADNPHGLWFKRKTYGWGWTPVTWQGWAVTFVYAALIAVCAATIDENAAERDVAFTFILPVLILTAAFIRIAYSKGESPRWQWGKPKE